MRQSDVTCSLIRTITERKRQHQVDLAEVDAPVDQLTAKIKAKKAKLNELERERSNLMRRLAAQRKPYWKSIDLLDEAQHVLTLVSLCRQSWIVVPIGHGHAIEPLLAAAVDGSEIKVENEGDSELATHIVAALKQDRCQIVRATIVVDMQTPYFCIAQKAVPPDFASQAWAAEDEQGAWMPAAMINDRDDQFLERVCENAPYRFADVEGDKEGLRYSRKEKVAAWAVRIGSGDAH